MKKTQSLKVVNVLLLITFLSQVISAFIRTKIPYEVFSVVHKYGGVVLLLLVVLHISLNWSWVKTQLFKK